MVVKVKVFPMGMSARRVKLTKEEKSRLRKLRLSGQPRPKSVFRLVGSGEKHPLYNEYMQSPEWKAKRKEAFRLARYKCKKCGNRKNLGVHHKTYDRLGYEFQSDLVVLCEKCHMKEHRVLIWAKNTIESMDSEFKAIVA